MPLSEALPDDRVRTLSGHPRPRLRLPKADIASLSPRELRHISQLSNLLFNPLLPGPQSPDWRRFVLQAIRDLTGAQEAILIVDPCESAPRIRSRLCRSAGEPPATRGDLPRSPCDEGLGVAGPWTANRNGDALVLCIPLVGRGLRVELHGVHASRASRTGEGGTLGVIGEMLQRWARLTRSLTTSADKPSTTRDRAEDIALPTLVLSDGNGDIYANAHAARLGIRQGKPQDSPMIERIASTPPWWIRPEPAPGLSEIECPDGEPFQVFRTPFPGTGELLVTLLPLSSSLPTLSRLRETFGLSTREAQATRLLARGRSTKGIARELDISWHTARGHVERVYRKLDISSRGEVLARISGPS